MTQDWKESLCLKGKVTEAHAEYIFAVVAGELKEQRNAVLSEVERGLPKTKYEEMTNKGMQALGWNECLESVSTIINNLRVK